MGIADELFRITRPGGWILIYDMRRRSPGNLKPSPVPTGRGTITIAHGGTPDLSGMTSGDPPAVARWGRGRRCTAGDPRPAGVQPGSVAACEAGGLA